MTVAVEGGKYVGGEVYYIPGTILTFMFTKYSFRHFTLETVNLDDEGLVFEFCNASEAKIYSQWLHFGVVFIIFVRNR